MRLTSGQIRDLIARGETFRLECKKAAGGLPSTLWSSYSAFSNSDGGVILLGVEEKNGMLEVGERSGMGLSNLFGVWQKMGTKTPTFTETTEPDRVELIVPIERIGGSVQKSGQKVAVSVQKTVQKSTKSVQKVGQKRAKSGPKAGQKQAESGPNRDNGELMSLNATIRSVYRALCENVELTHRELAKKLDLSRTTIAKATSELVDRGFIRRMGSRRGSRWEVLKTVGGGV